MSTHVATLSAGVDPSRTQGCCLSTHRCYSTAEEGALAYARSIGHEAAALEAAAADTALPASEKRAATRASITRSEVDLTAEEALAAAEAEGLPLVPSRSATGYQCVVERSKAFQAPNAKRPFRLNVSDCHMG